MKMLNCAWEDKTEEPSLGTVGYTLTFNCHLCVKRHWAARISHTALAEYALITLHPSLCEPTFAWEDIPDIEAAQRRLVAWFLAEHNVECEFTPPSGVH